MTKRAVLEEALTLDGRLSVRFLKKYEYSNKVEVAEVASGATKVLEVSQQRWLDICAGLVGFGVTGVRGYWILGLLGSEVTGFRGYWGQRLLDSGVTGVRGYWIPGLVDSGLPMGG